MRPSEVPLSWCECGMKATIKEGKQYSQTLASQWILVLASKNIPYRPVCQKGLTLLFVPPLMAKSAYLEICSFLKELPLKSKAKGIRSTVSLQVTLLALSVLVLWHALRMGWWGGLGLSPEEWVGAGSLSAGKLIVEGEWYRAVTSLTLHSDTQHLLGNCIFGGIALLVLALRIGSLNALCFTFFSGVVGNLLAVFLRIGSDYSSIGSSTALFGAMGLLCGFAIALPDMTGWRRVFFPPATALAWLAFLGMEGVRVDILAHVTGLASGIGFGLLISKVFKGQIIPAKFTLFICTAGALLIVISWTLALNA